MGHVIAALAASVVLLAPSGASAREGCNSKACELRVEKRRTIEAQGVPYCHMTWRCVRRAYQRHPHLRYRLRGLTPAPAYIARCESGGNPRAIGGGGLYRGKWQFDLGTWRSVGGSGDPAAASEAEQDYRAALLYRSRGTQPWPVCGG